MAFCDCQVLPALLPKPIPIPIPPLLVLYPTLAPPSGAGVVPGAATGGSASRDTQHRASETLPPVAPVGATVHDDTGERLAPSCSKLTKRKARQGRCYEPELGLGKAGSVL